VSLILAALAIGGASLTAITVASLRFARHVLDQEHSAETEPDKLALLEHQESVRREKVAEKEREERQEKELAEEAAKEQADAKALEDAALAIAVRVAKYNPVAVPDKNTHSFLALCPHCKVRGGKWNEGSKTNHDQVGLGAHMWARYTKAYVEHGANANGYLLIEEAKKKERYIGPCSSFAIHHKDSVLRWQMCFSCGADWRLL
jgi:hypothetical protein